MLMTIAQNISIAPRVYLMRLTGDTRAVARTGQFIQIAVPDFYLRRPISICDCAVGAEGFIDTIYKVVGHGTEAMAQMPVGAALDVLTGLGNGYDVDTRDDVKKSRAPLLIGGGVGVPPLYGLCKALCALGKKPAVILGFNAAEEIFYREEFEALGVPVTVTTKDGSCGIKGFVTDAMAARTGDDYVYACGPEPMLKAVHALCLSKGIPGQFSFEERIACGFGACMGCSCRTKYGSKRICKDGPVLFSEEIIW